MADLEDLLAPIGDDAPAGEDIEYGDDYAQLRAHRNHEERDADGYPMPSPQYDDVVDIARDILEEKSKDIRVALYLAEGLLHTEGFSGLHAGLEIVHQILERFPDTAHPVDPDERAYALDYLVGALQADSRQAPPIVQAIEFFPLTDWEHNLNHYQEWRKNEKSEGDKKAAKDSDDGAGGPSAANFSKAFVETSKEYYRRLTQEVPLCIAALEALEAWGNEYFKEKIDPRETPLPRYTRITGELKKVKSAADDLLARKLKDDPDPASATPAPTDTVDGDDATAGGGAQAAPSGAAPAAPASLSAEPTSPADAAARVVAAARFLRGLSPTDPSPYMMIRGLRWGELRNGGTLDSRLLEPPEMSTRRQLKGLLVDERWEDLLEAGERTMGEACGRGWLDLQRYILTALQNLGPAYQPVSDAIRGQLSALLADIPELVDATMMDDLPTTNAETRQWLELSGLLGGGADGEGATSAAPNYDQDRLLAEATHERARALAASGNARGGIEMLMKRADREESARARFITESLAASIMVDAGMLTVARPILEDIEKLIEGRKLAEWEPGDVVARPLGLLYRCLPANERKRAELYDKICRLDPVHAMTLDPQGGGGAQAAQPAAPARGQAFQPNEPTSRPQSGEAVDSGSADSAASES